LCLIEALDANDFFEVVFLMIVKLLIKFLLV
jgi:hypothetical protein